MASAAPAVHNRRFRTPARQPGDAHRPLGPGHDLEAILSIQEQRVVANDDAICFRNRFYQLLPPVWPGERGGRVVMELRLDGTMAIRFRGRFRKYAEVSAEANGEFSAWAADASGEEALSPKETGRLTYSRPAGGRVAFLQSPLLPTAQRRIAARRSGVQPKLIRGGGRTNGGSDIGRTADVSTVLKRQTFLLLPDTGSDRPCQCPMIPRQ